MFDRLRWHLYMQGFRQFGWTGVTGIVLGLTALVFLCVALPHYRQALYQATAELNQLKSQSYVAAPMAETPPEPEAVLNTFVTQFPSQSKINPMLADITKLAEKSGLLLDHSAYEVLPKLNGRLLQYRLDMPLKTSYGQIMPFLSKLYETFPTLAIEQMAFKRDNIDNGIPDTELHLVIYVRTDQVTP